MIITIGTVAFQLFLSICQQKALEGGFRRQLIKSRCGECITTIYVDAIVYVVYCTAIIEYKL